MHGRGAFVGSGENFEVTCIIILAYFTIMRTSTPCCNYSIEYVRVLLSVLNQYDCRLLVVVLADRGAVAAVDDSSKQSGAAATGASHAALTTVG